MPLQQWPNGGRLLEGRGGQVSFPADLTRCSQTTCDRSKPNENPPSPPNPGEGYCHILSWIFSTLSPPYVAFRLSSPPAFRPSDRGFQLGPRVSQWRRCLICCAAAR